MLRALLIEPNLTLRSRFCIDDHPIRVDSVLLPVVPEFRSNDIWNCERFKHSPCCIDYWTKSDNNALSKIDPILGHFSTAECPFKLPTKFCRHERIHDWIQNWPQPMKSVCDCSENRAIGNFENSYYSINYCWKPMYNSHCREETFNDIIRCIKDPKTAGMKSCLSKTSVFILLFCCALPIDLTLRELLTGFKKPGQKLISLGKVADPKSFFEWIDKAKNMKK